MVRYFFTILFILPLAAPALAQSDARSGERARLDTLIERHAAAYGLPASLVHRVAQIESRHNPRVISKGNYGLMQIRLGTARAIGYRGDAAGLLDPDTNLTYAVKYLAGAYRAANGNADQAVRYYQRGYYHAAKRTKPVRGDEKPARNASLSLFKLPATAR